MAAAGCSVGTRAAAGEAVDVGAGAGGLYWRESGSVCGETAAGPAGQVSSN